MDCRKRRPRPSPILLTLALIAGGIVLTAMLALSLWLAARLDRRPWGQGLRTTGATLGACAAAAVVAFGLTLARL